MGSGLKNKKKSKWMPQYMATEEQMKHRDYCIRNDIRISPLGIKDDPDHWRIEIRLGPYKRGEKGYIAPNIYDKDTIWIEYYRMCKYYYDKHTR
tara:strand:- start:148 stop:429 length:282 start_codon:yes stop_codon:yes gene_type:complete